MTGLDAIFIVLAVVTGGGAVFTVISRNLVHAALFLAITLAGIAGVFLLLGADFVALVQIVVYVGAITVLFLFGLMLTRAPIGREALDSRNQPMAAVLSGTLFVVLTFLIVRSFGDFTPIGPVSTSFPDLGIAIFRDWVLPFEVSSMLLLAALVGAVLLSRRETGESGQDYDVTPIQHALPGPGGDPQPAEGAPVDGDEAEAEQPQLASPGGGR